MSESRLNAVLDAANACFLRYGVRRTTMEDIAQAAGVSRSALYQHVRSKDDAFTRVGARMFDRALAQAAAAADEPGPLADRVLTVLTVKLRLVTALHESSPHAEEIFTENARLAEGDPLHEGLHTLLTGVLHDLTDPSDRAELLLSLTRGLEHDPADPDRTEQLLAQGVRLLVPATRGGTP